MKIVHLVLLLSVAGAAAACNGDSVTDFQTSDEIATVFPRDAYTTDSDTTAAKDSGHIVGSGN